MRNRAKKRQRNLTAKSTQNEVDFGCTEDLSEYNLLKEAVLATLDEIQSPKEFENTMQVLIPQFVQSVSPVFQ